MTDQEQNTESQRETQVQIMEWVNKIIDLLLEGKSNPQIYEIMRAETNKSDSQLKRYMGKATAQLREDHTRATSLKRTLHIQGLRADLEEAYAQYKKNNDKHWFKIYQEIKKELKTFEPDDLRAKTEQDTQTINITYALEPKVEDES